MSNKKITRLCNDRIPPHAVQQRKNSNGVSLSYADQHYIITRINTIFGPLGWSSDTEYNKLVAEDIEQTSSGSRWSVSYEAKVTIHVRHGDVVVSHSGTGNGHGFGKRKGDAIESACKEAETDALKRAARLFGPSLGLALYDKEQEDVGKMLYDNEGTPLPVAVLNARDAIAACATVTALYDVLSDTVRPLADLLDKDGAKELQELFKAKLKELKGE